MKRQFAREEAELGRDIIVLRTRYRWDHRVVVGVGRGGSERQSRLELVGTVPLYSAIVEIVQSILRTETVETWISGRRNNGTKVPTDSTVRFAYS